MECQRVRDRFSSYLEKELTPSDQKETGDHFRSCPECQKEFEKFEKIMQWLHSVEEVEVPDAFASELYQKMEERNKRTSAERSTRGLGIPFPFKLPVQAIAMIAVVFLVLYFVKTIPRPPSSLPVEEKPSFSLQPDTSASRSTQGPSDSAHGPQLSEETAKGSAQEPSAWQAHPHENSRGTGKGVEGLAQRGQAATERTPGVPRLKNAEGDKSRTPKEEKFEVTGSKIKTEVKKAEGAASKKEMMAFREIEPREAEGARAASRRLEQFGEKSISKKKPLSAPKPPQEIVLRISDPEKTVSQIRGLVEQFKGEMIAKEGNAFLVSIPASSFSNFEKKLAAVDASENRFVREPDTKDRMVEPKVKKRAAEEKGSQSLEPATEKEDRIVVRILLVQE